MPDQRTIQHQPKRRPSVSLTLRGHWVEPGTVSVRQLAEMLCAAASSFEAQAKELKWSCPYFALTGVESGSAVYVLTAAEQRNDTDFARVSVALQKSLQADARTLTHRLRRTLLRLSEAAHGNEMSLSFVGDGRTKTLPIPPPSSYLSSSIEEGKTNLEATAIEEVEPESELGVFKEIASELTDEGGFDAARLLTELRSG